MKKIFLFFAVMMMAVTSSYAKVYEVSFEKSENINIHEGQSKVINGVKITCLAGNIDPAPSWEPQTKGHTWNGDCTENDFQISTENGETITNIEITTEEESRWSMYYGVFGTGWTTITKGAAWTGSATSVNVGGEFEQVIKLTVTVDETTAHTHNYADAWSKDETNHWHACTGEGECDAPKSGEAAHSYGEVSTETAYYTCSVCQYENTTRKAAYEVAVKVAADQAAADAVVTKINAIGTVEYTEASKALIDDARAAYDALTDDQKARITTEQLKVLTDAEAEYANLKAAAEKAAADQAAADAVVTKINAIGTVAYTEASKALIDDARTAYNALTAAQKALVTEVQLKVLTDAEEEYARLKANHEAADAVSGKIKEIGTVEYNDYCYALIYLARAYYEKLTPEQKALITKEQYKVLTDAEETYARLKAEGDKAAADNVIALINAIGTVEYTTECKELIDIARDAYDDLIKDQQALISEEQYKVLTDAEAEYKRLEGVVTGIDNADAANNQKDGKYILNGKVVIVKNGKQFTVQGTEIK